jgi:hypothetical protein
MEGELATKKQLANYTGGFSRAGFDVSEGLRTSA